MSQAPAQRHLRAGEALAARGEYAKALAEFRLALKVHPSSPEAAGNAGAALHALGRSQEAVAYFERALRARPDFANAEFNYAVALTALGQRDEAERRYRRAVALRPGFAAAHANLGLLLLDRGLHEEALASFDRAIAADPRHIPARIGSGLALQRCARLDEAVRAYARAFEIDPAFAPAACNAGIVLCDLARYEEARDFLQRAIALNPAEPAAYNALGVALNGLGRQAEAIAAFESAVAANPRFVLSWNNLGLVARNGGELEKAAGAFRSALAIEPGNVEALANFAATALELGDVGEAERAFDRALQLSPRTARLYRGRADVRPARPGDEHVAAAERLYEQADSLAAADRIELHFALARMYEDLERFDESFDHLLAGNALKRATIVYDEAAILGYFDRAMAAFGAARMRELRGLGDPSEAPVFIVGMPRSGTTLVEQLLASHPNVRAGGERADVYAALTEHSIRLRTHYPEFASTLDAAALRALGARYLERAGVPPQSGLRHTDKMPSNFLHLGAIALMLPNAKIVHVRRDPVDTCLSCFANLFAEEQPHVYDLAELGRYYRAYRRLMEHWRSVLPDGMLLELQYEEIVADLEGQARRLLAHAGLAWDASCLAFYRTRRPVRTASAAQVRRPVYSSSIGRHRRYGARLAPLLAALEIPESSTVIRSTRV